LLVFVGLTFNRKIIFVAWLRFAPSWKPEVLADIANAASMQPRRLLYDRSPSVYCQVGYISAAQVRHLHRATQVRVNIRRTVQVRIFVVRRAVAARDGQVFGLWVMVVACTTVKI
jgi:hypothetical protein